MNLVSKVRLVLASASPRRADLLRAAGFEFETLAVDIDESARPGESARDYVRRLAMEKSATAQRRCDPQYVGSGLSRIGPAEAQGSAKARGPAEARGPAKAEPHERGGDALVFLGADTAVVVDGDILGKPRDDRDAAAMLRRLSGRQHEVMTGISLRARDGEWGGVEITLVEVVPLGDADVDWYVQSREGCDKAGAYAIQGLAARFIPRIEGSYSNVVGLPIAAVHEALGRIASIVHPGYSER
jgi:septum formation protein